MKKIKSYGFEFVVALALTLVFAVIGIFARNYFCENVIPAYYPDVQPDEWADTFFDIFLYATIACGVFNALIIVLIGIVSRINTKMMWLVYAIINISLMLVGPIYLMIEYPADVKCSLLCFLIFILEYICVYCVSTVFGPLGFCPYKSTKIRKSI